MQVNGTPNSDIVIGNFYEDDVLYGYLEDDTLYGRLGNDTLFGGQGNDVLFGGQGDDILVGGRGDDQLYGGRGSDVFEAGWGNDTVWDLRHEDRLLLTQSYTVEDTSGGALVSYENGSVLLVGIKASEISGYLVSA